MVATSLIWTGIVLRAGYSCVMEKVPDPDENKKQRCSQWKNRSVSLNLYISWFWPGQD